MTKIDFNNDFALSANPFEHKLCRKPKGSFLLFDNNIIHFHIGLIFELSQRNIDYYILPLYTVIIYNVLMMKN